mgnify:CR=1 FL=1
MTGKCPFFDPVLCKLLKGEIGSRGRKNLVQAHSFAVWMLRENVRAQLRVLVKLILRKHGYPPDKQEKVTQTVLAQAEVLSGEWASA